MVTTVANPQSSDPDTQRRMQNKIPNKVWLARNERKVSRLQLLFDFAITNVAIRNTQNAKMPAQKPIESAVSYPIDSYQGIYTIKYVANAQPEPIKALKNQFEKTFHTVFAGDLTFQTRKASEQPAVKTLAKAKTGTQSVSYTHLTLPTILLV